MKMGVVLNPVAGAGKAARDWPGFEAELARQIGDFTLCKTTRPEDASILAREMADDGFDVVVAAGGDGTIGETADGLLKAGAAGALLPRLGVLPCGTGSDFARMLSLGATPAEMVERIAKGAARTIDAGRVTFVDDQGRAAMRYFINISSLGLSGPTSRAVNRAKRNDQASGRLVFMWHTIRELIRYRFQTVCVSVDGAPAIEASIALVAAANGRFFGGGMMIAPDAQLDDGLLDLVIFRGAAKLSLIRDLRLLYTGSHRTHPAVTILRGSKITVEPASRTKDAVLIDVDGESPGRIPATFEVIPRAIDVYF